MVESTLSLAWDDFKSEVGFFLGYGRTIADWAAQGAAIEPEVELIVHAGVRRVYFPPGVPGVRSGYEWSWMRPTTTINLGASGSDGAITGVTNFDSATFSNWTTQGITSDDYLDISVVGSGSTEVAEYSIASVADGVITLDNPSTRTGATVPANGTSLTFRLVRSPANYDLPIDVSRIVGELHYPINEYQQGISVISVGKLLEMRSQINRSGYARYAAIRYKSSDGTSGSRLQEILFHPEPDAYKILTYQYEIFQDKLSDSAPYPLGGMNFSELYVESCLAVAEQRSNDDLGLHTKLFQELLVDAVLRDGRHTAQNYGQVGNKDRVHLQGFRRGYIGSSYSVEYKGEIL